jgi:predicted CoA-substrate-specific enzyme activase
MTDKIIFAGIDVGTTMTKAVVVNVNKVLLASYTQRSGTDYLQSAKSAFEAVTRQAGISQNDVQAVVATGFGRKNIAFAHTNKTEIACHGHGCSYYYQEPITVVDIGGQDSKIIKLDADGKRLGFKMNRKCAAGTGAFLEDMANKLNSPLSEFNNLALTASETAKIGSYCTVFTATEVLDRIKAGEPMDNIIRGLFDSITKRIVEMDTLTDRVIMTGGVVAFNPIVAELLSARTGINVEIAPHPQVMGAFGAALFAEEFSSRNQ